MTKFCQPNLSSSFISWRIPFTASSMHRFRLYIFIFLEREHPSCPPPITPQQSQQNLPPRSNLISLKRTASSMSNSSSASTDRKTESPKDVTTNENKETIRAKPSNKVRMRILRMINCCKMIVQYKTREYFFLKCD